MSKAFWARALVTVVPACGAILNSAIAGHLITLWHSLKWDSAESEWESTSTFAGIDSVKLACSLLSLYFSLSAILSCVGFVGSIKHRPAYIRVYRDYWIVDLTLTSFATLFFAMASFNPIIRSSICEEISRQPQISSELGEAGFDLEDCEPWLERSVVAGVGVMAIVLIVRLQFTIALNNAYRLFVHSSKGYRSIEDGPGGLPRRIFLLPERENSSSANDILVYAPVPLSSLSNEETRDLQATEAWFSQDEFHMHRKTHRRSNSTSHPLPQSSHRRRPSLPPQLESQEERELVNV